MRYILPVSGLCLVVATAALAAQPKDNVQRGRQIFAQCASCHSGDGSAGVGPSLRGVYGRLAGSAGGYAFSPAMKGSGIVWNDAALDAFLHAPQQAVPRNRMPYGGMANEQDRQDVIAYLAATK